MDQASTSGNKIAPRPSEFIPNQNFISGFKLSRDMNRVQEEAAPESVQFYEVLNHYRAALETELSSIVNCIVFTGKISIFIMQRTQHPFEIY